MANDGHRLPSIAVAMSIDGHHHCALINLFRTAVPFRGQTTQILSNLSPKWDCGP